MHALPVLEGTVVTDDHVRYDVCENDMCHVRGTRTDLLSSKCGLVACRFRCAGEKSGPSVVSGHVSVRDLHATIKGYRGSIIPFDSSAKGRDGKCVALENLYYNILCNIIGN